MEAEQTAAETLEQAFQECNRFWRTQRTCRAEIPDKVDVWCVQCLRAELAALRRSPGGTCATCRHYMGETRWVNGQCQRFGWALPPMPEFGCTFHTPLPASDPQEAGR